MNSSKLMSKLQKVRTLSEGVRAFLSDVLCSEGVVVSVCNKDCSGCFDFGLSLGNLYRNLDFVFINLHGDEAKVVKSSIKFKDWNYVILTGCESQYVNIVLPILEKLKGSSKGLDNIHFLLAPHESAGLDDESNFGHACAQFAGPLSEILRKTKIKYNVVTSGVNIKNQEFIGLPRPYPEIPETKFPIPENCYGLIYFGSKFERDNPEEWLAALFAKIVVKSGSKCKEGEKIEIQAIVPLENRELIDKVAKEFPIKVKFIDRLPQAHYIDFIRQLSKKGKDGIVAIDGAQSLLQAIELEADVFCYCQEITEDFLNDLINLLPEELKEAGAAILNTEGEVDTTQETFDAVQRKLQKIIELAIKHARDVKQQFLDSLRSNYVCVECSSPSAEDYVKKLQASKGERKDGEVNIKLISEYKLAAFPRSWLAQARQTDPKAISDLASALKVEEKVFDLPQRHS